MTEAEFNAMLARAAAKKAEKQELAQANAQRRQGLLEKAIRSNKVRVDYVQIDREPENIQGFFDQDLQRRLRQEAATFIPTDSSSAEDTDY